jgi:hypothetical protein
MSKLSNWISSVQHHIFFGIKDECNVETIDDFVDGDARYIIHQEVDEAITYEYLSDVEDLVHEYGIDKALCLYINTYGAASMENIQQEKGKLSRMLLYAITDFIISNSYEEYKKLYINQSQQE